MLRTKRVNIVTDGEFKFDGVFPVGKQLYCWNRLEHDLQWYLRSSNCSPSDIAYVVSKFKSLMNMESETEFNDRWDDMKKNGIYATNKICKYFDNNLLPSFKSNAAIWTLKSVGLCNSHNGVTNNASESMNAVIRRLQKWNLVPVDVITNSFYQLCAYYHREIQRSLHQCGSWMVRNEYQHFQREPSLLPRMYLIVQ